jgi:hypothetical protein
VGACIGQQHRNPAVQATLRHPGLNDATVLQNQARAPSERALFRTNKETACAASTFFWQKKHINK